MKLLRLTITIVLLSFFNKTIGQTNPPGKWMRYPAISPDGKSIAFCYKGDLFRVSVEGGIATQLTTNPAYDFIPVWSHSGDDIAFASNRHGNFDVFLISKHGGTPKRLTYHSADDTPSDFSSDDDAVIFSSVRLDLKESLVFNRFSELYKVNLDGGRPDQLLTIPAWNTRVGKNGDYLFEEIKGYEDEFRKHHTSSITRDIWHLDRNGTFSNVTNVKGEDRNGIFGSEKDFYFLSERNGTFNVFKSSFNDPSNVGQVSDFKVHPVRYLSISDDGMLCYNYNGGIYTQKEGEEARNIDITIYTDESILPTQLLFVSGGVSEMALSPKGKEIAFIFRGEVFVTSVDGSMIKRITSTSEQERSIGFSPDGRSLVYAGERNNSWNIYTTNLVEGDEKYFVNSTKLEETPLIEKKTDTFQPVFSPDGKEVAFLEERTRLKVINIESKVIRTIHDGSRAFSYADGDQHFSWSPDGKWLLIEYLPNEYWFPDVGLVSASGGGEIRNLTKSGFSDQIPMWSKDSTMIFWATNRSGLKSVANSGPVEVDIFGMFLTNKGYNEFKMSKEEFELFSNEDEEENEDDSLGKNDKRKKKKKQEEEEDKPIEIEFSGIFDRKVKLTIHSSYISDAVISPDGKLLLYFSRMEKGYDLWQTELRTKDTKMLARFDGKPGKIELDKDGENIFILADGKITKVEIESGEKKPIEVNGEMRLNEVEERAYLLNHIVFQVRKKFLDPNLHGVSWDELSSNYEQFLPSINNNHDFSDLLSELLGELNASHTGARFYFNDTKGDQTASLGAFYNPDHSGIGLQIEEIMDKSPLIRVEKDIKTGTIIEKIDGVTIEERMNYFPLLNRKAGKIVLLSLFDPVIKNRWEETVKPISQGEERELKYQRWIKLNRDATHLLSDGKIGYMHVRSMSDGAYRDFLEKVMGEEFDKDALIVDTRFNGGGDLLDDLTTFLSGKNYQEFHSNGRRIGYESQRRWTKPSIMLVGESNYSDAHCVPAGYRDLGLGKIVGMPVPGTCSFVWWERLQNGIVFGIPNMAVHDKSGDILENKQLEPDIKIMNDFEQISNGKDQQLEEAVHELLEVLD